MIERFRLASGNAGKARELGRLLGRPVEPIADWVGPPEDADSFVENARIKARAGATACPDEWVIADDSGLEVDALDGEPGVNSARYGGPGLDDADRCALLLRNLADHDQRAARFRCVLVALGPNGEETIAEASLEGAIVEAARGEGGFGYDPVFAPAGSQRTCGELAPAEKDAISHRGAAVRQLRATLAL